MMNLFLSGAIALASLSVLVEGAQAQTPVTQQCPQATWMAGYQIWELMPLAPNQYKTATVTGSAVNVRQGAGFDSVVVFTLPFDYQVTITGESWDLACNQWMRIRIGTQDYWMHGDYLRLR